MRFLHAADIHLGNKQYNLEERYDDFYFALEKVTQAALDQKVSVCVIAGDLFHKSAVDPYTLLLAEQCLKRMREAGIYVIAVAGNHDRQRYRDDRSWLHYLDWNGYLKLLEPQHAADGAIHLIAGQSYVDVNGVRFIGVPWYGAATNTVLQRTAEHMPLLDWSDIHYTVLITHAGIEGEIPDVPGCLKMSDLAPLRQYVNYVATGHLHKPFVKDQWIYNPGAIENCDFNEELYRKDGKGAFVVDVADDGSVAIEKQIIPGRPFHTMKFITDTFLTTADLTNALRHALISECQKWEPSETQPVVRVLLRGNLAFDRTLIDVETLRQNLQSDIDCLYLRLEMQANGFAADIDTADAPTFEALELQVFEEMARQNAHFSNTAESWGVFMQDVKELALREEPPEQIYERLRIQLWGGK